MSHVLYGKDVEKWTYQLCRFRTVLTLCKVYCCFYAAVRNTRSDTVRIKCTQYQKFSKDLTGKSPYVLQNCLPSWRLWETTHRFWVKGWGFIFSLIQVAGRIQDLCFSSGVLLLSLLQFLVVGHSQFLQGDVVFVFYSVLTSLKTAVDSQVFQTADNPPPAPNILTFSMCKQPRAQPGSHDPRWHPILWSQVLFPTSK